MTPWPTNETSPPTFTDSHPLGTAFGVYAQSAWAAGELALMENEGGSAAGKSMTEPVRSDRAGRAAGCHVLYDAVVVPVPHFDGCFVEQHRELGTEAAQQFGDVACYSGVRQCSVVEQAR